MKESKAVTVPNMCRKHQALLTTQAKYGPNDCWQLLIVVSQVALFQFAITRDITHKKLSGDITKVDTLGCLACCHPDAFGEIVEAAKTKDLGRIKILGDKWINKSNEAPNDQQ